MEAIFQIVILFISAIIHEVAHGYSAYAQGDETAKRAGRLTLNPLVHLEMFGSIILPLMLYITHAGFFLGWAKPVPYNPNNLGNRRWGEMLVAIAGPATNLGIAVIFGLIFRALNYYSYLNQGLADILSFVVVINLALFLFNMMPVPPLDGSKVLFALLPKYGNYIKFRIMLETYGMFLVLALIFFAWPFISPAIYWMFNILTGMSI